jgi:hypothetical protein
LETNTVDVWKKEEIEVQIHEEYKERKERKEELDTNTVEEQVKKERKRCQVITKAEGEVGRGTKKSHDVELGLEMSLNSKYWSEGHKVQCMNWLTMQSRGDAVGSEWNWQATLQWDEESGKWMMASNELLTCVGTKRRWDNNVSDWDSEPSCLSTASAGQWHYTEMVLSWVTRAEGATCHAQRPPKRLPTLGTRLYAYLSDRLVNRFLQLIKW